MNWSGFLFVQTHNFLGWETRCFSSLSQITMHQLWGYLILEEETFLWTITKITFFQFTKTGRERGAMLEAVAGWRSWSISSHFKRALDGRELSPVCCCPESQRRTWILFSHQKASKDIVLWHQDSPGSWSVSSRAAGVLLGKFYNRHHFASFERCELL